MDVDLVQVSSAVWVNRALVTHVAEYKPNSRPDIDPQSPGSYRTSIYFVVGIGSKDWVGDSVKQAYTTVPGRAAQIAALINAKGYNRAE